MKIGIIGAMNEEIVTLTSQLLGAKRLEIANQHFTTGKLENHDVIILQCGIGKVNAAVGTSLLLNLYNPDYVINTGVAGGLNTSLNVGDVVVSSEVRYHDVDLTTFGYEFGQMAKMPAYYSPNNFLSDIVEKCICNISQQKITKGLIVSGDSFINNPEQTNLIKKRFGAACAVEMEACAIAHVCYLFETPFVIIRSISDTPDTCNSTDSFKKFLSLAANKSATIVTDVLREMR